VDPVLQRRHGDHLRERLIVVQPRPVGGRHAEPVARVVGPLQEHLEQPVAEEDLHHPVPEQTGPARREDQRGYVYNLQTFNRIQKSSFIEQKSFQNHRKPLFSVNFSVFFTQNISQTTVFLLYL
jgi:hypothetical protein